MEGQRLEEIPVKDITPNPRQPRQHFDQEQIDQMARSIETFGVVQPVVVRPVGTEYELIAGERRWRAAQEAGLERIPAVVKQSTETDSLEIALIENLHRSDLNGIEEATAYQQLLEDFAITHEELSRRVGKSRAAISNAIRLLQLPPRIQKDVLEERVSTGHARALLALQDSPELQEELRARIIEEGLSVRQTEELCGAGRLEIRHEPRPEPEAGDGKTGPNAPLPGEVQQMLDRLAEILDARVKGSMGKRKGKVVIEFRGVDDLQRIVSVVTGPWEDAPETGTDEPEQPTDGGSVTGGGAGTQEPETANEERGEAAGRAPADHWGGGDD